MESPAILSARRHIAMFEETAAKRRAEIESGNHQIDEATTRDWLKRDEAELEQWKRILAQAAREAAPVEPLA